jgi:hypothetical protein
VKLASLFLKVASSTASYKYRTRYYSEASSCGNGEGEESWVRDRGL